MNNNALAFFGNMANSQDLHQNSVKLAKNSDFSLYDSEFIMKYADHNSDLLDLGTGTGLVVNKIYKNVKSITAVEPYGNFTKFIVNSENITIVNEDIFSFTPDKKFDLLTLIGVMNYFNEYEAIEVYRRYFPFLKEAGKIIIKNQFGVHEDVNISGFSEELGQDYYSQYRHIDKEVKILRSVGYAWVEVFDIYPAECNRWGNTHFYALVAGK